MSGEKKTRVEIRRKKLLFPYVEILVLPEKIKYVLFYFGPEARRWLEEEYVYKGDKILRRHRYVNGGLRKFRSRVVDFVELAMLNSTPDSRVIITATPRLAGHVAAALEDGWSSWIEVAESGRAG